MLLKIFKEEIDFRCRLCYTKYKVSCSVQGGLNNDL